MKIKKILSLRFIKVLPILFILSATILLPSSDRSVYAQKQSKTYGISGDTQLIWGRTGTSTYSELWDIWGTSASDIFAVGSDGTIIHYNGTAWHTMESTRENVYGSILRGVWGTSSTNVYAVGSHGAILHYDGTAWSLVYGGDETFYFFDVWGSSASDIFAVGQAGTIVHYDGNTWSTMDSGVSQWQLTGVWGSSASDVFVVGESGTILHYDGDTWTPMDGGIGKTYLWAVWGTSATDVYVGGSSSTILHYDGGTWNPMTAWGVQDIWGTSSSDIFAVGGNRILHYDGSTWSIMIEDVSSSLYGVWGSSASGVYAVGDTPVFGSSVKSTILYYGDWDPRAIWVIPNREEPYRESVTDFVQTVGESKSHLAFRMWCDPLFAAEMDIDITNDHPAFSINSNRDNIRCNSYYHINFTFTPTEPGLAADTVTVSGDVDTISFELIGNGVPRETPEYWIAELPGVIAWRLAYDAERDLLYITDSSKGLLVVFSIKLRQITHHIPIGSSPRGMSITPDGNHLYVANSGEYSISKINIATMGMVTPIPVPPLHPHPSINPTPYDIAVVDEDTALIGGDAGYGSGGPIYELDLITHDVSPREDIGGGNRPVLGTSLDFSTTAILLEPGASPSTVARYDSASDSSIAEKFDIERGVAINKDGSRIAITYFINNVLVPDLRLVDRDLNDIMSIKLVEIPLGIDFHPSGKYIYATGGYNGSVIEEVSTDTLIQTRYLDYQMPEGFDQIDHPETLVVSKDGRWVYVILLDYGILPLAASKLLAVKINRPVPSKTAVPCLQLLLLDTAGP